MKQLSFVVFGILLFTCLFCNPEISSSQARERQACEKVKALVALPHQTSNPTVVHWTPFIDDLINLLDGLPDYEVLCEDLKILRVPSGFRTLKLILIARRLNNHQEIFKKMCEREEPLSFREGRQIAKYIRF